MTNSSTGFLDDNKARGQTRMILSPTRYPTCGYIRCTRVYVCVCVCVCVCVGRWVGGFYGATLFNLPPLGNG